MDAFGPLPSVSDQYRGTALLATLVVTFVFASSLVVMRVWTRTMIAGKLGWDDYLVVIGVVSTRTHLNGRDNPQSYPDVRCRGHSSVRQGTTYWTRKACPFSYTRASLSGRTLGIRCAVHRRCIYDFCSTFCCLFVDADLWDDETLETGAHGRHWFYHRN